MKNNNSHKGFKIFLIIFILLVFFFVREENQQKAIDIFNSFKSREKDISLNKTIEAEENEKLYYLNGNIIKWNENTITFLDESGKVLVEKEFAFEEAALYTSGSNLYYMDKHSGDIYLMSNKGDTLSRFQIKSSIFNIKEENDILFVHLKEDNREGIKIINLKNEEEYYYDLENILTYSISLDNNYIISSLHLHGGELNSIVMFYNKEEGVFNSLTLKDEIILLTQAVKDNIIILTDRGLNIVKDSNIIFTKDYPLVKDMVIKDDRIYLLYGDNLEILNLKGEIEKTVTFGLEYNQIVNLKDYIALYGARDILLLNGGEELLKYKVEEDIINVYGNNNTIVINYLNKLEIYDIINKE